MKNSIFLIIIVTLVFPGCSSTVVSHSHNHNLAQTTHYPSGMLQSVYIVTGHNFPDVKRIYREDGSLASVIEYKNGKMNGFKNTYYPDGGSWRKELYEDGVLIEMIEYDEEGRTIFELQNY